MELIRNNRGAIALKTIVILLLLGYGTFAGYKYAMTVFTKSAIVQKAEDMITKIKGPILYNDEKAEDLLIKVLRENGVYESDKINPVYAEKTEDGRWVNYEFTYRIRTDYVLFKTKWETIKIIAKSDVNKRM